MKKITHDLHGAKTLVEGVAWNPLDDKSRWRALLGTAIDRLIVLAYAEGAYAEAERVPRKEMRLEELEHARRDADREMEPTPSLQCFTCGDLASARAADRQRRAATR